MWCRNNCKVLLSCCDLPSLRYHMRGDWRESPLGSPAGLAWWTVHDGCGTDAELKHGWAFVLLLKEKLPRVGFRIDIIKDYKDSLSARNTKYWSKKDFQRHCQPQWNQHGSWKVSKHTSFHFYWKTGMSSCFWICRGHLWWCLIPTDVF